MSNSVFAPYMRHVNFILTLSYLFAECMTKMTLKEKKKLMAKAKARRAASQATLTSDSSGLL